MSMATRSSVRRPAPRPVPARPVYRPKRRLRRVVTLVAILAVALVAIRAYVLLVYAPGLRSEASTIPGLVRAQLTQQGAAYVPIDQTSPDVQHAVVSIEDHRFYSHPGVDPLSMARAFWVNLRNNHVDQGGSTLEEQLVKRAIVQDDRSARAKLRTIVVAWAVDQQFSKPEILELYLNAAYFGQGAYGIGAAAHVYFGTDAAHLTLPQAAFLAALPQAPSVYGAHPRDPVVTARVIAVLTAMQKWGYITPAQEAAAESTRLSFSLPGT